MRLLYVSDQLIVCKHVTPLYGCHVYPDKSYLSL